MGTKSLTLKIGTWIKYQKSAFRISAYGVSSKGNPVYIVESGIQLANYMANNQESIPIEQATELDKFDLENLKWIFNKNKNLAQNNLDVACQSLEEIIAQSNL